MEHQENFSHGTSRSLTIRNARSNLFKISQTITMTRVLILSQRNFVKPFAMALMLDFIVVKELSLMEVIASRELVILDLVKETVEGP